MCTELLNLPRTTDPNKELTAEALELCCATNSYDLFTWRTLLAQHQAADFCSFCKHDAATKLILVITSWGGYFEQWYLLRGRGQGRELPFTSTPSCCSALPVCYWSVEQHPLRMPCAGGCGLHLGNATLLQRHPAPAPTSHKRSLKQDITHTINLYLSQSTLTVGRCSQLLCSDLHPTNHF